MTTLLELGSAVRTRRTDMGITQTALAKLSGLSRATVNQLETGAIKDLSVTRAHRLLDTLGLSVRISPPRQRSGKAHAASAPIDVAARSASVSYRHALSGAQLRQAILSGDIAAGTLPHMRALLDEAPLSLIAAVVAQLHDQTGTTHAALWKQLAGIARRLQAHRALWWL